MKNIIVVFVQVILLMPLASFSQELSLIEPNVKELKDKMRKNGSDFHVVYYCLVDNYPNGSSKRNIKYEFPDHPEIGICSFEQGFDYGIHLYENQCGEGGESIEVALPIVQLAHLKSRIEKMDNISGVPSNEWYENGLTYGPKGEELGCTYKIKDGNENWIVCIYCGC